jgi:diamine N-acetyltransferase
MVIEIKKILESDLEFLNQVRNTYANLYLHDSRIFTLEETLNWFNTYSPNYYIIFLHNTRIGYFRISNFSEINKNVYVGADLDSKYHGQGLAYKSYLKFIPFLFESYNLNKISLEVLENNERAICLYKKLGFKVEGIKREEVYKNGKYINSIIMSILHSEFKDRF